VKELLIYLKSLKLPGAIISCVIETKTVASLQESLNCLVTHWSNKEMQVDKLKAVTGIFFL